MPTVGLCVEPPPLPPETTRAGLRLDKKWPVAAGQLLWLPTKFLDTQDATLKGRVLSHLNAWAAHCGARFAETSGEALVRIARTPGAGHWCYLGTDARFVPAANPTMNLDSFSADWSEAECRRVVRHEGGHALALVHGHQRPPLVYRIDPQKTVAYFAAQFGWPADKTLAAIAPDLAAVGPPPAENSVMTYHIPGECTVDGQPIAGGTDIIPSDAALAALAYPPPTTSAPPPGAPPLYVVFPEGNGIGYYNGGWGVVHRTGQPIRWAVSARGDVAAVFPDAPGTWLWDVTTRQWYMIHPLQVLDLKFAA